MTGWLLDTTLCRGCAVRNPSPELSPSSPHNRSIFLYVSAATMAEIRFGIELVADPSRRAELHEWLTHKVRPMFVHRVLAITEDVMFRGRPHGRGRP